MVEIRSNSSFPEWFEVICDGQLIEEAQGRRKTLKIAKEVAKKHKERHIASDGKIIDVDDD